MRRCRPIRPARERCPTASPASPRCGSLATRRTAGPRRPRPTRRLGSVHVVDERTPGAPSSMPEPVKPQRILITGGAGFIGVHTVNRLAAEGLELLVIDDRRHACGETLPSSVQLETVDPNGTGEAGVVAITCDRLLSDRPPEIRGDGQQTRDFVFVGDVAEANWRALQSRADGAINIGTGVATSVRTVVEELARLAEFRSAISFVEGRPGEVRDT